MPIFSLAALGLGLLLGLGCNGGGDNQEPTIGPNLNGNYVGRYHIIRTDDSKQRSLTATIRHSGSTVIINTSLIGRGASLTGTIEPNGEMELIDPYDGELWTTYFREATTSRVEICDFLYEDDLGSTSPLQIIDLAKIQPQPVAAPVAAPPAATPVAAPETAPAAAPVDAPAAAPVAAP